MMAVLQTIGMAWLALFVACVILVAAFRMVRRALDNDGRAVRRKK